MPPIINKKEVKPILPMNIKIMRTHFPKMLRSGVIPKDRPTVPKAEQTSKRMEIKSCWLSEMLKATTDKKHMTTANSVMANDFMTSSG